jgi:HAE1 family hydrophobic/amphiphilic exporter-1
MMSARLLRAGAAGPAHGPAASRRGFYGLLDRGYTRALRLAMRARPVVVLVGVGVVLSAWPLYGLIRQDYLPSGVDEGEFNVTVSGPQGASLAAMDDAMRRVEADLRAVPGVRLVLASVGGSFLGAVNEGRAYVRLAPHAERTFSVERLLRGLAAGDPGAAFRGNYSQREVMQAVRRRLARYRDLRIAVRNPTGFNIGGGGFEVDFVIRGPDLGALARYADRLRERAPALGLLDADTTLKLDKPELRVELDRARAADLRVDTEAVATAVRLMVGGDEEVSRFRDAAAGEDYDVQLRLREADRDDPAAIGRLYVPRADGGLVRLDSLVRIARTEGPSRIDRLDRQREVRLRTSIAPGYALADRLEVLRAEVDGMNLPAGYTTRVSGRGRELERTFREFLWAFLLSVIFMYMILASQFESLAHPFTILLSLPLAVPFALLSIWLTGGTLNLYSALGILVLFGVVKKNAILQIDHMNSLRAAGLERAEAILQGNRDRLRPILMTTLTFVMGMVPLAVGTGPGAEERRAIAIVVIGGQTLSLFLTLLVTPVVYSYLDDLAGLARRRDRARAAAWRPGEAGEGAGSAPGAAGAWPGPALDAARVAGAEHPRAAGGAARPAPEVNP